MAREFFEFIFCFFNDTATTEIYTLLYTLSLHERSSDLGSGLPRWRTPPQMDTSALGAGVRSEEHTSELQSHSNISYAVFCLKKKKQHQHQLPVAFRERQGVRQWSYRTV